MNRVIIQEFPNGITVRELQTVLENWSKRNPNGEDCEVWVRGSKPGLSSPITRVTPLNRRSDSAGEYYADLYLEASHE